MNYFFVVLMLFHNHKVEHVLCVLFLTGFSQWVKAVVWVMRTVCTAWASSGFACSELLCTLQLNTSEGCNGVHFEIYAVKYGENDLCRKVSLLNCKMWICKLRILILKY